MSSLDQGPRATAATEYIKEWQAKFPKILHNDRNYSEYLRQKLTADPGLRHQLEEHPNEDYGETLLSRLKLRLPEELASLIDSRLVAAGEVNDPTPNAFCHTVEGGFAIIFNVGLKNFVYRIIRAFSTRFAPTAQGGATPPESAQVSFEDTCRFIGDIFLWYCETKTARGPDYSITDDQITIANLMTIEANLFFVAHEFAHGLQHLYATPPSSELEEELLADRLALQMMLGCSPNDNTSAPVTLSYAAVELALLIWQGLEKFGVTFEGTHPRAADRLVSLRAGLAELCPDEGIRESVENWAKLIRLVFENVMDQIRAENYGDFLKRAADDIMHELDDLLDHCTGGEVPDYYKFYSEAHRFFDQGYSLELSRKIAETASHWLDDMERRRQGVESDGQEALVKLQKHKLFVGFVNEMEPETRRIFGKALGFTWT
jgi:hypothetical protein